MTKDEQMSPILFLYMESAKAEEAALEALATAEAKLATATAAHTSATIALETARTLQAAAEQRAVAAEALAAEEKAARIIAQAKPAPIDSKKFRDTVNAANLDAQKKRGPIQVTITERDGNGDAVRFSIKQ